MQVVVPYPDVEKALSEDVAAGIAAESYPFPPPNGMRAPALVVHEVGGSRKTPASFQHDLVIHCYASSESGARSLASDAKAQMARISNAERGISDAVYKGITSNPSYINPDPLRPLLSRCSFSAVAEVRGVPVY